MKLYKDICSTWISRTSADIFFSDWRYKQNTIDLLLLYRERFYGLLESDKTKKKGKETK